MEDLTARVQESAAHFSPSEAQLAAHLVENMEAWSFQPTTEISSMVGLHRSTIVRFAQRLGFSGFPELQEAIRVAFLGSVSTPLELFDPRKEGEGQELLHAVANRELDNLKKTYARLDQETLVRAGKVLADAHDVLILGRRFSHAIALNLSSTLKTLRRGVRLGPEPGGSTLDVAFDLGPQDAAVVISLRRHSQSVQRALQALSNQGVPTVLLTDASPVSNVPPNLMILQAHIGSTSTLNSFTALVSLSHILCTLVAHDLPDAQARWQALEKARSQLHLD